MATFTTKRIVDEIIAANGQQYDDEPPVIRIVEYTSRVNQATVWGVVWQGDRKPFRYDVESEFVTNPRVIFEREP